MVAVGNFREGQLKRIVLGMQADVYVMSRPNVHFDGVVDSIGFGVKPDPDVIGRLENGLPDVQRTLNWVHLAPTRQKSDGSEHEKCILPKTPAILTVMRMLTSQGLRP